MSDLIIATTLAAVLALFTTGLIFSFVRRQQTGKTYFLFWRIGHRTHAIARVMFFRGTGAELGRILLFAIGTLICISAALEAARHGS